MNPLYITQTPDQRPPIDTNLSGHDGDLMTVITYADARENLASTMDRVCQDREPVMITGNQNQVVVMLSLDDYEALQETSYLLRNPANARRLFAAIESAEKGNLIRKSLADLPT